MQSTSDQPITSLSATRERSQDMRPSRSCLGLLLGLMFLAGLASCGPAPSDNAPNFESRASVGGPALSKQGLSSSANSLTLGSVPFASGNETGQAPGKGTVAGGDSRLAISASSTKLADTLDLPVLPMAKELDSPDAGSRPYTLETWAQSAQPGAFER